MIKKTLFAVHLITVTFIASAQYVFVPPTQGTALDCHVNVNGRSDQDFRNDIKRAVFRLTIPQPGEGTQIAAAH